MFYIFYFWLSQLQYRDSHLSLLTVNSVVDEVLQGVAINLALFLLSGSISVLIKKYKQATFFFFNSVLLFIEKLTLAF